MSYFAVTMASLHLFDILIDDDRAIVMSLSLKNIYSEDPLVLLLTNMNLYVFYEEPYCYRTYIS